MFDREKTEKDSSYALLVDESKPILPKSSKLDAYFVLLNEAYIHSQAGRYIEALSCYDRYVRVRPYDAEGFYNRGVVLAALGYHMKATEDFQHSLLIQHDNAAVLNNYGASLLCLKQFKEALNKFERSLSLRSDNADTWHNHGAALFSLGDFKKAIESFDRSLSLRPGDEKVLQSRALVMKIMEASSASKPSLFKSAISDKSKIAASQVVKQLTL